MLFLKTLWGCRYTFEYITFLVTLTSFFHFFSAHLYDIEWINKPLWIQVFLLGKVYLTLLLQELNKYEKGLAQFLSHIIYQYIAIVMKYLSITSCVTLGKLINLSGLPFLDLGNRVSWTRSPRCLVVKCSMFTELWSLIWLSYPLWEPWMLMACPFIFVSTVPVMTLCGSIKYLLSSPTWQLQPFKLPTYAHCQRP